MKGEKLLDVFGLLVSISGDREFVVNPIRSKSKLSLRWKKK